MFRSLPLAYPKTLPAHVGREWLTLNDDEPTFPNLLDAPTLPNLRRTRSGAGPEPAPAWPLPSQRVQQPQPPRHDSRPHGWLNAMALGASLILLLSLFGFLVLPSLTGHAGIFSSGKSAAQSSLGSATPTATRDTTAGWLLVAPTSVSFGCADHQRTQNIVLENRGSQQVHWQADFAATANQAAVALSPGNGDLGPGESTVIQLQSTTSSTGLQGIIRFTPSDPVAGPSASLSFTAVGCN